MTAGVVGTDGAVEPALALEKVGGWFALGAGGGTDTVHAVEGTGYALGSALDGADGTVQDAGVVVVEVGRGTGHAGRAVGGVVVQTGVGLASSR